jgi:hypothetical protein
MGDWRTVARAVADQGTSRLLVADFVPAMGVENTCVCVLAAERSDGAVLDVAARLAMGSSAVLLLVDGSGSRRGAKRAESFAGRLRQGGIIVEIGRADDHPPSTARFVVAALPEALLAEDRSVGTAARRDAELAVLVHPRPDEEDELDHTVEQVRGTAGIDQPR